MPNWCSNVATINHGDKEKIDAIEAELKKDKDESGLFQMLHPRPADQEEQWYEWNTSHWGTKWEASIYDFERLDDNNIKINFDTAWSPPIAFYDYIFEEGYDTTAYYDECGMGFCGKYEFGMDDYYDYTNLSSDEIRDCIPTDLDEVFSISQQMEDREAEEDYEESEEDVEDEEPEYEMTEWFDVKTKPVHLGLYEVEYDKPNAWPFPSRLEWTGKKWINGQGEVRKDVGRWRGITESEHNMLLELQKLKDEFDKALMED
jgi:hypothetical protein